MWKSANARYIELSGLLLLTKVVIKKTVRYSTVRYIERPLCIRISFVAKYVYSLLAVYVCLL